MVRVGREPSGGANEGPFADFGEDLGIEERFDLAGLEMQSNIVSLDAPIGDEWGGTLGDYIADSASQPQPDDVDIEVLRERLARALDALPGPERKAMSLRFGQEDGRPRTLAEISDELGMAPDLVRRIQAKLLARLRCSCPGAGLESLLDD